MMIINKAVIFGEEEKALNDVLNNVQDFEKVTLNIRVLGGGAYNETIEADSFEELEFKYYELAEEIYAHRLEHLAIETEGDYYSFNDGEIISYILNNIQY